METKNATWCDGIPQEDTFHPQECPYCGTDMEAFTFQGLEACDGGDLIMETISCDGCQGSWIVYFRQAGWMPWDAPEGSGFKGFARDDAKVWHPANEEAENV